MLTAQAIKDQEFQIKFRGYDAIEVKAYLEQLAEDFFELGEQNRVQAEEIEALLAEQQALQQEKENLVTGYQYHQSEFAGEEIVTPADQEQLAFVSAELEATRADLARVEEENRTVRQRLAELESRPAEMVRPVEMAPQEPEEMARLRARLEMVEEQNRELKQEGIDFKSTIVAAQKFADTLRQSAEEEARQLLGEAKVEVEQFRHQAEEELARLPKEIEALRQQKMKVKKELKAVLLSYLSSLEETADSGLEVLDEYSELFQSIQLPGDDAGRPDTNESGEKP